MRRAAALGWVAVVFAVGLAAGLLGGRLLEHRTESGRDFGPPPFRRYFSQGDLALNSDQQAQIEEIFRRQRDKFEAVQRDLRPQVEALMDETQEQIEAVLTPEQLERYRSRRDRWHRRGHREPGGPGFRRHLRHREPPPVADTPPPDDSGR